VLLGRIFQQSVVKQRWPIRAAERRTRVIEGRFTAIQSAIEVPKGTQAGLRYLKAFIEKLKASRQEANALQCVSSAVSN
jgi:hypothetical protein